MVITVLEARVASEQAATLENTFRDAVKTLDPGIVQTYLLHALKDAALWQIVTIWESREVLDAMRNSGQTPRGVLIFKAAGAEPTLHVYGVQAHSG